MKMKLFSITLILLLTLASCGSEPLSKDDKGNYILTETSLEKYNIPVVIDLPKGVSISKGILETQMDGIWLRNLDLKKGEFNMSSFFVDTAMPGTSLQSELANDKNEIKSLMRQMNILEEVENGYFYEFPDRGGMDYGFTIIVPKNGSFVYFETGMANKNFDKEVVKQMFLAAQTAH